MHEVVEDCIRAFEFLETDFGYRNIGRSVSDVGFKVAFGGDEVGVLVEWAVRDGLATFVVLLDDGELPAPIGEMRPDSHIAGFHLADIEIISGVDPPPSLVYGLPTRDDLAAEAARLRAVATPLLRNDRSLVPALRQRVLDRARRYALEKWGSRASEFGW